MSENVKRTGPPSIPHPKKKTSNLSDPTAFKKLTEEGVERISKTGEEMKKKKRRFAQTAAEEPVQKPQAKAKPSLGKSIFEPKPSADIFGRNIPKDAVSNEKIYGKPSASSVSSPPFLQGKEEHSLPSSERFFEKTKAEKPGDKKEKEGEFVPLTLKEEKVIMEAFEKKEEKKPEAAAGPALAPDEEIKKAKAPKKTARKAVPIKKKKAEAEKPVKPKEKKKKEIEIVIPKKEATVEKTPKEEKKEKPAGKLQELAKSFSPITILDKEKKKKKTTEEPLPTKPQPIPSDIINQAVNATTRLTPYISTDVHNLFAQMVSTVMVMKEQDVTTTQVTLTSSAFQNSIFEGATITLQRYATAPDSFNITLKGSDQAVKAFNQNIDSLHNAFARGRFPFRIGKLEASYEKPKPLVRRKKSAREKGT